MSNHHTPSLSTRSMRYADQNLNRLHTLNMKRLMNQFKTFRQQQKQPVSLEKKLMTYLIETYQIQKVLPHELSDFFDGYFQRVESSTSAQLPELPNGLFYCQSGNQFISFRSMDGDCDAEAFSTELQALCWLVIQAL